MESKAITIEELRELKPSQENPVVLKYIKDVYCPKRVIEVVMIHGNDFVYINENGHIAAMGLGGLESYTLKPKERETITLYETVSAEGILIMVDKVGSCPSFPENKIIWSNPYRDSLCRKTGRTMLIDKNTFEMISFDDGRCPITGSK